LLGLSHLYTDYKRPLIIEGALDSTIDIVIVGAGPSRAEKTGAGWCLRS